MIEKMKELTNRQRGLIAIAAAFTTFCLLAAAASGIYLLTRDGGGGGTISNPVLVDPSTVDPGGGDGRVVEVAIGLPGGGGAGAVEGESRMTIRLSKGEAKPAMADPNRLVTGDPLTEAEIEAILARLPQLETESGDSVDFRLPSESLPPPRTGETVDEPFPPPEAPPVPLAVAEGPLEVLRFAPEGEIGLAPFVNVTFNQPMVPLGTLEFLAEEEVPVQIVPTLPGRWKWVGTKTLTFEHDSATIDRLPMATEYVATVPAGAESATGGVLAESVSWRFSTPPAKMISSYPYGDAQPLEPIFFVAFDQRIDPSSVLSTIQVMADGQPVALRLATESEVGNDEKVTFLAGGVGDGRWLAFRATSPLPADSGISVNIGPGTPSAEGPRLTTEAQRFDFRTYAPLRIEDQNCARSSDPCWPLMPFSIRFNNPLDVDAYDETMLQIEPAIPGATVNIAGSAITIRGATNGRTRYQVTVDGDIQDIFGQTLGKDTDLTFHVGPADPLLIGPDETFITLDPASPEPIFTVYAINHDRLKVRAYDVEPADWPAFKLYLQEYYRDQERAPEPPGELVMDETITIDAATDSLAEVSIDLSKALDGDFGQLIVTVEPTRNLVEGILDRNRDIVQTWVQVSQIGLDALADHSEMVVWATSLADGAPLPGLTIDLEPSGERVVTGDDGTVRFALPTGGTTMLVASQGEDRAFLPRSNYLWSDDSWERWPVDDALSWHVFDDRQMYRPGEEVHLKGWIRLIGAKQDGDIGLMGDSLSAVSYQVIGPQGNELTSGRAEVNALGGFDFAFTLPENANLGQAHVQLNAEGNLGGLYDQNYYHPFQIQEFRRPEFEVTARNESTGPYFVGDQATVAVSAEYFAGGPLPNAEVTWVVTSSPSSYSPPNWPDFNFGTWTPWWFYYGPVYYEEEIYFDPYGPGYDEINQETFTGLTDGSGEHFLNLEFESADEPRPYSVVADATVMDVNRQAWGAATTLLVHPSDLYVGMYSASTFVQRGEPLDIEIIVTDLDGEAIPGRPVNVEAARLEWQYDQGHWGEQEVDVQGCQVESTLEPVSCSFETKLGGEYQITALVADDQGRLNRSRFTRWVSGGQQPPSREVEQEAVTLIPDKENYQPGDTAKILVQSPFNPAEGLLTVSRSGILYTERFRIDEDTTTLLVPIEEGYIPNLHLQVDLAGAAPRTDDRGEPIAGAPSRPAYASGQLNLSIPPLQRTLTVEATPQEVELEPGGETIIDVTLTDASGRPVSGAEVAVVVVDEAILALTNYQLADPLATFYQLRSSDVDGTYGRASIVLANPEDLAAQAGVANKALDVLATQSADMVVEEAEMAMAAPAASMDDSAEGLGGARAGAEPQAIKVRTDFNPLATFAAEVPTDSDGRAQVEVSLPDNLTRYRVMVVAVAGDNQFGSAEANMTARLPLMVRPSAPRFLNFGDRFELPVVLQNQTDEPMIVDVVVEAGNIELTDGAGQSVTVPARDRVEVRFPATTVSAGTARFQIAAVAGDYADAATVVLPVYTPATTEAFATYGVVDEGAVAQPVAAPGDVFPQFGGLEITTSSTALQALTDAVLYLTTYPYDSSGQLASRILAIAALRDVLTAFSAEGLPSPAEMEAIVQRDIDQLFGLQNYDGGFPYWRRGKESIPFNTIHVAHALQQAEAKGFVVPAEMRQGLLWYLTDIEDYYPEWYSVRTRQTLSAYALYVRFLMADPDQAKARALYDEAGAEGLSLEALAWLWTVLADDPASAGRVEAIQRHITNRAVETAGAANFTISYGDQAYLLLHSDRRTDAIILDALIANDPESDLIPKVVNGLLAHRTRGRWSNTQENVFVLLALDRYFNTFESQTPDFVAQIWLGDTYAGGHEFEGRTTERHETVIPMAYLVDADLGADETQDLIMSKDGPGRLYYRLGLRYAPSDLELDPLDMGFVVQRTYEAVDDPEDVYQDEDGVWHMKAGARVRVRLTMVADNRRYHVALEDPLPAGLEIINPALAVTGDVPQDPSDPDYGYGWWWWWPWYEHQNMRDQRAEAFTSLLWEGVYQYDYVTRATTPGTFVVPPAKAEEMYSPEVFGRSGSDLVIVE